MQVRGKGNLVVVYIYMKFCAPYGHSECHLRTILVKCECNQIEIECQYGRNDWKVERRHVIGTHACFQETLTCQQTYIIFLHASAVKVLIT